MALSGGEDYELAFTLPPGGASAFGTRIGRAVRTRGVRMFDSDGSAVELAAMAGFDHFA
jgi:thiamine monophosphate kinase